MKISWHFHVWGKWQDSPWVCEKDYKQYRTCQVCNKRKSRFV